MEGTNSIQSCSSGFIMKGWMKRENEMICCCSDDTRPVIFKIERIDEEYEYQGNNYE